MTDLTSRLASERSTQAVVFCDVTASTELRERLGDADADGWFAVLSEGITAAVNAAGGTVVKWLGDGAMAVFHSAGAALDAAVSMQQAAHDHQRQGTESAEDRARLRVGVSIGDVSSSDGDWFGMPVVQAARLCAAAEPERILAADIVGVLAGSRSEHAMKPAGEYTLKGITEPVVAVEVGWEPVGLPTRTEFPAMLATALYGPFVGRNSLLEELQEGWKSGAWRAVIVGGENGIGKTRFVAELARRLHRQGVAVVAGRCDEEVAISYRPWAEAVGPLIDSMTAEELDSFAASHVGELRRLLPDRAARLDGGDLEVHGDADARHAMLADAIVAVLRRSGRVVAVIDDLQWIDVRSLQVVRHVLEANLANVTIIGTYADTDLDRSHALTSALADLRRIDGVERLGLTGLDHAAVAEFVEQSGGRSLAQTERTLAGALHAKTAGNPLFVGELLRDLGDADGPDSVGSLLPEALREVIGRRLARLGDAAVRTLRIGAAIGPRFEVEVVEQVVTDDEDVLDHLEQAEVARIVADVGDHFEFRHGVIRQVLLDDLSTVRRRRLHRDLVAVLEQRWADDLEPHLAELAYHHMQARSPDAAGWCARAAAAAVVALDARAIDFSDQGLEMLEVDRSGNPGLRCDLLIARALGVRLTGIDAIDDARRAYDAAVQLGDQRRIAEALLSVTVGSTADDQSAHVDFLVTGLKHLTDEAEIGRWETETALVVHEYMDQDVDASAQIAHVAEIVSHLDPTDTKSCQIAMRCARSLTSTNQPREAVPVVERFLANCDGLDTEGFPVEVALSTMWLHLGDRGASDRYLDDAASDPRRNYWFFDCQVLQRLVMRDLLDGRWDSARESVAAVSRVGGHDPNLWLSCATQSRWLMRETGDTAMSYATAREFEQAMPDFAVLRALLVSDTAEAGFEDEARERLDVLAPDDFRNAGRGWLSLMALAELAWAAITVDATGHAATLTRLLQPYSGQIAVMATGTHVVASVSRLLAGLAALQGHDADADRLFEEALAQERGLRSLALETRALHWWGRALHRRGDGDGAAKLLGEARGHAADLGMHRVVAQIDAL